MMSFYNVPAVVEWQNIIFLEVCLTFFQLDSLGKNLDFETNVQIWVSIQ